MKRPGSREWKNWVMENGSYKLVALFVTLILWVTILGRRDFQLSKEMDLEFLLPHSMSIAQDGLDRKVTVKVSGPRVALKKFSQNPGTITIDLVRSQPGPVRALITPRNVEVPFGVKVISINPDTVNLNLIPSLADGDYISPPPSEQTKPADHANPLRREAPSSGIMRSHRGSSKPAPTTH